jgi:hypothetical protein
LVSFEDIGEEETRSVNRDFGFSSSSSSDERTAVRFCRFAGGAMAVTLAGEGNVLHQPAFPSGEGIDGLRRGLVVVLVLVLAGALQYVLLGVEVSVRSIIELLIEISVRPLKLASSPSTLFLPLFSFTAMFGVEVGDPKH